jgi:hypothetical protein
MTIGQESSLPKDDSGQTRSRVKAGQEKPFIITLPLGFAPLCALFPAVF